MIEIADEQVRQQALDISNSYAVAAPAGSGKTGLLTRRLLKLLAVADTPEQLLAITFTRKAAAEMQRRIIEALHRARDDSPPENDWQRQIWLDARAVLQRDQAQNWQLLASPSRLRILTIDGLCRYLARLLAVESGLGEPPEPLEFPQPLYQRAVRDLLAELETNSPTGEHLATLLRHLDNDLLRLETLLVSLLEKREQWLESILATRDNREILEYFLGDTIHDTLNRTASALAPMASELAWLADFAAANLQHLNVDNHPLLRLAGSTELPPTQPTAEALCRWRALTGLLMTGDDRGAWRKTINRNAGFPTAKEAKNPDLASVAKNRWMQLLDWCRDQPGLLEQLNDIRFLPDPVYSPDQWHVLDALTRLLPRAAAGLSLLFRERGCSDFTEITLGALRGLGTEDNPANLALQLDNQWRHILVDEFQDTSSIQYRLLHQLLSGWHTGDGRTLFIVGDGMQSLYGFRNANVGLFLEARRQPVNEVHLHPLDLQVNFRSGAGIVHWVNRIFDRVFPAVADISRGAVPYSPASAAQTDEEPLQPVTLTVLEPDAPSSTEARQVLALIEEARAENPNGTIAILARKRGQLRQITAALNSADIAWQASDIDALGSRMPVIDMLSLTRALVNPADRIAWLALLRAPWAGLDLKDLERLVTATATDNPRAEGDSFPWLPGQLLSPTVAAGLSPSGRRILERLVPILSKAIDNRYRKPLRLLVEGVWLALGGPAALASTSHLTWCQQYLDLLEQHSRAGTIEDMTVFEQAVQKLYAAPATTDRNAVRVMTIHKAKGLEFDTVIIPGLDVGGRPGESELLYWRQRLDAEGNPQLLISPPVATGEDSSALVAHLKRETGLKQRLEDARVLYVACTRAISRLHLLFRQPATARPSANSLLACLWPALQDELESPPADVRVTRLKAEQEEQDIGSSGDQPIRYLLRLPPDWRLPRDIVETGLSTANGFPVARHLTSGLSEVDDPDRTSTGLLPLIDDHYRHAGTVLHRTLRQVVIEGVNSWNSDRIRRQSLAWQLQLRQLGVLDTQPALATLNRALETMLMDNAGRWILDGNHQHSACELALNSQSPAGPEQGDGSRLAIIDRTFVDQGCRWIIDYKLAEPAAEIPDDLELQQFIATQRSQYADQLRRYARLFESTAVDSDSADGLPVKTALYFPLLARLEVIDLQEL